MGMNVGSGDGSGDPEVLVDSNTTPLIDVMLVLLIMLIITIPIQTHAVKLNMPVGNPPPPTGATIACTPGACSRISSAIAPWPALTRALPNG